MLVAYKGTVVTTFSSFRKKMTSPCIVCFKHIHVASCPGLKTRCCGQYQCETCMQVLAEHCAICDRRNLNRQIPCETCQRQTSMFLSRVCESCDHLCCISCSEKMNCCVNSVTGETICVSPPLIVNEDQIDEIFKTIREAIISIK